MKVFEKQFIFLTFAPKGSYRELFLIRKAIGCKLSAYFTFNLKKQSEAPGRAGAVGERVEARPQAELRLGVVKRGGR